MMGLNRVKCSKQMRLTLLVFVVSVLLVLAVTVTITKADIEWEKSYGGVGDEVGHWVENTTDGGYIIVGYTNSSGAGEEDVWLIKTDANGDHQWNKTYGGTEYDEGTCVVQTSDGGYIITGATGSYGAGLLDVWLIKTDANGDHQWNKTYGGTDWDEGTCVVQTSDGGYIITGATESYGAGASDVWLIKTNANGDHQWNKTYGGTDEDEGSTFAQTSDGGYIITGYTCSYGADPGGSPDFWLIKTDANGNHQWNQTYGGTDYDEGNWVEQTTDGGYIITGSKDLDYFDNSDPDIWLIKTDANGDEEWNKTYGGTAWETGLCVVQTSDGGYIIAGAVFVPFSPADVEALLIKTDENGNKEWEENYDNNAALCVLEISDGEYIIVGDTVVSAEPYDSDVWLAKVTSPSEEVSEFLWNTVLLAVATIGVAVVFAVFFKKRKQEA